MDTFQITFMPHIIYLSLTNTCERVLQSFKMHWPTLESSDSHWFASIASPEWTFQLIERQNIILLLEQFHRVPCYLNYTTPCCWCTFLSHVKGQVWGTSRCFRDHFRWRSMHCFPNFMIGPKSTIYLPTIRCFNQDAVMHNANLWLVLLLTIFL